VWLLVHLESERRNFVKKLLQALLEILQKPHIKGIATHVWVDTILDVIGLILILYLALMMFFDF
jgi:hypothetical protein